jgi:hypothetical protein
MLRRIAFHLSLLSAGGVPRACAEPLVPGTGEPITSVGDDFEDPHWQYRANAPKSSQENDGNRRQPGGSSTNGRWAESAKRGQPDIVRLVETPPDGLAASHTALLLQSRYTGVPGQPSGEGSQDDLLMQVRARMHGHVPVSWSPNVVVRVFLPAWDQWESAKGNSFGLRADVEGFRGQGQEEYWPGIFIRREGQTKQGHAEARLMLRADQFGRDFPGPQIRETGWWTLGMSFSPDGQVHYYARPGVDALTDEDHVASSYPYGFRCKQLDTIIFNIANRDAGQWSTPWIIDDPTLYFVRPRNLQARRPGSASKLHE